MKALIFAAGLGTRLRPLTDIMPKALVPVAGVPMLERIIRKLQASGIDQICINTHHFAAMIEEFIEENSGFGAEISISREEKEPLETGGGIRHARGFLEGGSFLVHNVDILSNMDLAWFAGQVEDDSLATLLVHETEADRYLLFDENMYLVGWTNVRTGEVKSPYPDFNASAYRKLGFSGIHILSDKVFGLMESWPEKFSVIDFYLSVAAKQKIKGVVAENLELVDIGSPEKLGEAELLLSESVLI